MTTPVEIDPEALEPTIDLDLKTQKRILTLHGRLDRDDYYSLLGVDPSSDKKQIRSAYFDRMNEFHADKFYGKNIGAFGPRLQRIVAALTKANDVLAKKISREEYDKYLETRNRTLGARVSIAPSPRDSDRPTDPGAETSSPPLAEEIPFIPRAPRAPFLGAAPESNDEPDPEPASPRAPSDPGPSSPRPLSDAARRLLARKMGRKSPVNFSGSPLQKNAGPTEVRKAVDADLKARYDARKSASRERRDKYINDARAAEQAGDWAGAVNAMRIALSTAPEDPVLQGKMTAMQRQADIALAPKFLEQAKYEEKDGSYERAARSYERAAIGRQSAALFNSAAKCLLLTGKLPDEERRKVVELARQAVALDNTNAHYRVTLARAYDVAGMKTSALGEVRRALELSPNDKDAKELHKALK